MLIGLFGFVGGGTAFRTESVSIGEYDGRLINASFGINYQAFEHAGIGLSYNVFDLDVGINKASWRGAAEITYEGLYASLSFYWSRLPKN